MKHFFPYARAGQKVGLFGGSFDPAHRGHVALTLAALRRFDLDAVWWMISPSNPLKARGPAQMGARLARARAVMQHPQVQITVVEAHLGTRYTAQTIAALQERYPRLRFTWLMGADNLAQFHLWQDWQQIMARVPVGVIARPGTRVAARASVAARRFRAAQIPPRHSRSLGAAEAPAWCFINMPMVNQSSTRLRALTGWGSAAIMGAKAAVVEGAAADATAPETPGPDASATRASGSEVRP